MITRWIAVLVIAYFLFGVGLMVMDEILGVALYMTPPQTYPYPIGPPLGVWIAWDISWAWVASASALATFAAYTIGVNHGKCLSRKEQQ
jgi:hypothetical protein